MYRRLTGAIRINATRRRGKPSKDDVLWTSQKNAPAARPLTTRDKREVMKTAILTGMQQQKYLRLAIVFVVENSLVR